MYFMPVFFILMMGDCVFMMFFMMRGRRRGQSGSLEILRSASRAAKSTRPNTKNAGACWTPEHERPAKRRTDLHLPDAQGRAPGRSRQVPALRHGAAAGRRALRHGPAHVLQPAAPDGDGRDYGCADDSRDDDALTAAPRAPKLICNATINSGRMNKGPNAIPVRCASAAATSASSSTPRPGIASLSARQNA